jgi:lysophospholipase L1-like esterase
MPALQKIIIIASILSIGIYNNTLAQPFKEDIESFRKQDSIHPPPQHAILFVGSSSFTKWKDVKDYFPGHIIINRGFGGSSLTDVIRYSDEVIFKYQPKQVVIYCGDNDLAASDTVSAELVVSRFKNCFSLIRERLPGANISFVSIKPSPSRFRLMPKVETANRAIEKFLATQSNTSFIDVFHAMLSGNGTPMPTIFLADSLHMNAKGYEIWKKAIEPHLMK